MKTVAEVVENSVVFMSPRDFGRELLSCAHWPNDQPPDHYDMICVDRSLLPHQPDYGVVEFSCSEICRPGDVVGIRVPIEKFGGFHTILRRLVLDQRENPSEAQRGIKVRPISVEGVDVLIAFDKVRWMHKCVSTKPPSSYVNSTMNSETSGQAS